MIKESGNTMALWLMIFFLLVESTALSVSLGEIFDDLSGKYTSPYYKECIDNKAKAPWYSNSAQAFYFARAQFEKYSIEATSALYTEGTRSVQIPKIIHQIWLGGGVPERYLAWMSSWTHYHPDWTYIVWTDDDIKYLELVNKNLFDRAKNYGEKADILRLELLDLFGGLYIDTDYECYQPFDILHYCNKFYVSALGIGHCGYALCNGLIGTSRGHPLIQKLVNDLKSHAHWGDLCERTGPIYCTRVFFQNMVPDQEDVVIYPPRYFTPGSQDMSKNYTSITSYAKHWFDASWGRPMAEKRICKDSRIEQALTPLYLKKYQNKKHVKLSTVSNIIEQLGVQKVVELGACQFFINQEDMYGIHYVGVSPVKFLTLEYRLAYPDENRSYLWKDWLHDVLPSGELVIIGDTIEYLPFDDSYALLKKVVESDAEFFVLSHDVLSKNQETKLGKKRSLNMCAAPFNLPQPDRIFKINKKTYGLWKNK